MKLNQKTLFFAIVGLVSGSVLAATNCDKSYAFRADVPGSAGQTPSSTGQTLCDSKATAFVDALKNFNSSNLNYTDTSAALVNGRFSDVNVVMSYAANSTRLNYNFVELGDSGSFQGATRKESQKLLEDYLKKNGIIGKIMSYQAKNSPTSPISGTGGLIPMTISADFNASFTNSPTAGAGPNTSGAASNNLIGANVVFGSYNIDNTSDRVTVISAPLSYTIRNDIDPRRQLSFSLPVTLVKTGNAQTAQTGLGMSYRLPLNDNWTITPAGRYSLVASEDRATLATLYSASVTSVYVIPLSSFDISIGNMLGYYKTGKFSSGDYSFNPEITSTAMRNGVMLSQPVNFGKKMTVEYSLVDTRFFGDKPFTDNLQEVGIAIGTNKGALDARSFLRAGLNYMRGPGTKGISANVGYWF